MKSKELTIAAKSFLKKLKIPIYVMVILTSFVALSSCEEEKDEGGNFCNPTFQADLFEENLGNVLDGNVMGYCYAISKNGNLMQAGAVGKAQSAADGNIDMSLYREMHIASISKFITTMAAIHVCRIKGLPLSTKIGPYLPTRWNQRGTGIDDVTIAELITQTAGLNQVGTQGFNATRFDSLRMYVAAGATGPKVRSYTNTHCGLLRVILPRVWDKYRDNTGNYNAEWFESVYKTMIDELLFDKIGITGDTKLKDNNQILAYINANDNTGGAGQSSDYTPVSGGLGWNLTCFEVAKFWAFAWNTNDFINNQDKEWAKQNRAGIWNTRLGRKYGDYYCKLGGWSYTSAPAKSVNCCAMLFPDGTEIVVFVNSNIPGGASLADVVAQAYEDAYGC